MTVAVFLSTLHAQDFRDASGDRMTGRRTFPILYPVASRVEIGLAIPLWSIFLSLMWQLDWLCASAFIAYGHLVGARFVLYRTVAADRLSCKYYGVSDTFGLRIVAGADQVISCGSLCTICSRLTGTTSTAQTSFLVLASSRKLLLALLASLHRGPI